MTITLEYLVRSGLTTEEAMIFLEAWEPDDGEQ